MEQSNASEIFLLYAQSGNFLEEDVLIKITDLPNAEKILLEYVRNKNFLTRKCQALVIDKIPNAEEILLELVNNRWCVFKENQIKIFDFRKWKRFY